MCTTTGYHANTRKQTRYVCRPSPSRFWPVLVEPRTYVSPPLGASNEYRLGPQYKHIQK